MRKTNIKAPCVKPPTVAVAPWSNWLGQPVGLIHEKVLREVWPNGFACASQAHIFSVVQACSEAHKATLVVEEKGWRGSKTCVDRTQ